MHKAPGKNANDDRRSDRRPQKKRKEKGERLKTDCNIENENHDARNEQNGKNDKSNSIDDVPNLHFWGTPFF